MAALNLPCTTQELDVVMVLCRVKRGKTPGMDGIPAPGTYGKTHEHIKHHKCHNVGHYVAECPGEDDLLGLSFLQSGHTESSPIPSHWVLLDSQSTVLVFCNSSLLNNIRESNRQLCVSTNGGVQVSRHVGDIPNFGTV